MLRQMTWLDYLGWLAYMELEPFDETRADLRSASIVATIANVNRGKGQRAYSAKEFLLNYDTEVETQDGEAPKKQGQSYQEQKQIAMMWAAIYAEPEKKRA